MSQQKTMKSVFTVVERDGQSHWLKLGVGFVNKDGSLNLKLDALPLNKSLHVRDFETAEEREAHFARLRNGDPDRTGSFPGLS